MRTLQLAPTGMAEEMERHVSRYYRAYQDGHLLVEGGIADQPARYLEWMEAIEQVEAKARQKYKELNEPQAGPTEDEAE